jgi:hypothetical protein
MRAACLTRPKPNSRRFCTMTLRDIGLPSMTSACAVTTSRSSCCTGRLHGGTAPAPADRRRAAGTLDAGDQVAGAASALDDGSGPCAQRVGVVHGCAVTAGNQAGHLQQLGVERGLAMGQQGRARHHRRRHAGRGPWPVRPGARSAIGSGGSRLRRARHGVQSPPAPRRWPWTCRSAWRCARPALRAGPPAPARRAPGPQRNQHVGALQVKVIGSNLQR